MANYEVNRQSNKELVDSVGASQGLALVTTELDDGIVAFTAVLNPGQETALNNGLKAVGLKIVWKNGVIQ